MKYQYDPFIIEYDQITEPVGDFRTEVLRAAKKIEERADGKPIMVCMSGGMDSEFVAEALYAAGVPFTALIGSLVIKTAAKWIYLNDHDTVYAFSWCDKRNIRYENCIIDAYEDAELLTQYAIDCKSFSPQYACHCYYMNYANSIGHFFVVGLGDIDIVMRDGEYYSMDTQRDAALNNFHEKHMLDGEIRFVKQDSRLTAAALKDPIFQELMQKQIPLLVKHKHRYYSSIFPNIADRPKYSGFEKLQEWDKLIRDPLKELNGHYDLLAYTPISFFKESK